MRINNLNEQIDRIKSLFTEERMFGNLITEDVSGNSLEEYTDLLKSNGFEEDQLKNESTRYTKLFCLLYTSPSPRDRQKSRMPSSA